jgi:hypothetical protein
MKWQNYAEFAANHPELGLVLEQRLLHYPPSLYLSTRAWVEKQLKYIAVRPWESLDMSATSRPVHYNGSGYTAWYHIENNEPAFWRARAAYSDGPATPVRDLLQNLQSWYGEYWAEQEDRPFVLDAIIKYTTIGTQDGYPLMSFDIYFPPADFHI